MAATLPPLTLHEGVNKDAIDAPNIAKEWLAKLDKRVQEQSDISDLFVEESWWRDIIALSWDWTSKHGPAAINKYLESTSGSGFGQLKVIESGGLQPAFVDMGAVKWLQSGFTFQTDAGNGRGLFRLANVGPEEWKAWIVLTQLDQLKGQEKLGSPFEDKKPHNDAALHGVNGVDGHHKPVDEKPTVLIVGAGEYSSQLDRDADIDSLQANLDFLLQLACSTWASNILLWTLNLTSAIRGEQDMITLRYTLQFTLTTTHS